MFRRPSPGPQPRWKYPLYLLSTVVLWMLLGVFVQILLLILGDTDKQSTEVLLTTWWRPTIILVLGVLGFVVGRIWWRWIYVEGRWSKKNSSSLYA